MAPTVKPKQKRLAKVPESSGPDKNRKVEVIAIDLLTMELGMQPGVETASESKAAPVVSCSVEYFAKRPMEGDVSFDVAYFSCKVGREESKDPTEKLLAAYLCFFDREFTFDDDDDLKAFYGNVLSLSVWPRFRDLMGMITVQGGLHLPEPPIMPRSLKWGTISERPKSPVE